MIRDQVSRTTAQERAGQRRQEGDVGLTSEPAGSFSAMKLLTIIG